MIIKLKIKTKHYRQPILDFYVIDTQANIKVEQTLIHISKKTFKLFFLFILLTISLNQAKAQSSLCGPTTPTFTVNLTGFPNGSYMSPPINRADTCCGSTAPDRCVQFVVTLDTAAVGLIFTVCVGAVPPGSLYYQINCGPPQPVGTGICVTPPYPVILTFCKPGNNTNQYCIQSVSPPHAVSLSQNCRALMWTWGYLPSSVTWNSIFPGPYGSYNNYLSCQSGCDSTWVTPTSPWPPYIDYQVCGTAINGCNKNFCDTIRVTLPPPITTTVVATNVSCAGAHNGTASATTSGGTSQYTYSWSTIPPQYTPTVTGLYAGTYTCTVTDSAGCKTTNIVVITSPTGVTALTPVVSNVSCFGMINGTATVTPTGGSAPYTYSWNPGGQTTTSVSGLPAGVYTITVTDANGCTITTLIQVTQPALLTSAITASANVSCFGGSNGSATISASGGTYNYTYHWSNNQNTSTATGLTAGNYSVIVTDAHGCTSTNAVVITQPATPLISFVSSNPVSCFGTNDGSATVSASGATPNYTYSWSTIPVETTANVTDLYAGVYTVTVTDANGCTSTNTVSIATPTGLTFSAPVINNVNCFGNSTGSATAAATGGNPPYTYLWNPTAQTTSTATGLPAGIYTVTVTDNNGCIIRTLVQITQPAGPLISAPYFQINVSCFGGSNGSAGVSASGGTPNYTYHWSNNQTTPTATGLIAGNYSVTVTDAHGCTSTNTFSITQPLAPLTTTVSSTNILCFGGNSGSASVNAAGGTGVYTYSWNPIAPNASSLSGLIAGSYTCTTIDANGCTKTNTFAITQPPAIVTTVSGNPNNCLGKNATLNASTQGGVSGYSYSWNPSAATASTIVVSPTASTTYTLTTTDANGCTKVTTQLVNVFPQPIAAFSAPNSCLNNATVFSDQSTGGGTIWSWNFGEPASGPNNISTIQNPGHTYGASGTFTVTLIVSNANGCADTITKTLIVNPIPSVSFTSNTICFGNTTTFNNPSFITTGNITNWAWNFGDPNSGPNNLSGSQSPTHIFTAGGTFYVILTATSDSGCQSNVTLPVIVHPLPTASFVATLGCTNTPVYFTNASSLATQWLWDFGNSGGASLLQNPSYTYPSLGSYVVTLIVTSAGGCRDTVSDTVNVNPSPVPNFSPDSVCVNFPAAFHDLTIAPGGNITNWIWNFGDGSAPDTAQNPTHTYALPGTYTVSLTVTSSNGCKATGINTVLVFPQPTAQFSYSPNPYANLGDEVDFTNQSFSNITNWYWYFGDSSAVSFIPNPSHVYNDTGNFVITLIVQDNDGCMDTVQEPLYVQQWTFYIPNAFTPNGNGKNDFFFGKGIGIKEYEMWIFDRWGNLIFSCQVNDLPQSLPCHWNGKVKDGASGEVVQEDVYVWKVHLVNVFTDEYNYVGTVTVVK